MAVTGLSVETRGRQSGSKTKKPAGTPAAPAVRFPDATPVRVLRTGDCDRGERETIRRRLLHAINALAAELDRKPGAVAATIKAIARDDFSEYAPLDFRTLSQNAVRAKYALT